MLELSQSEAVSVGVSAKRVTVEGGALGPDVYDAIAPRNLSVVGGVITSVGVSGLQLVGRHG